MYYKGKKYEIVHRSSHSTHCSKFFSTGPGHDVLQGSNGFNKGGKANVAQAAS